MHRHTTICPFSLLWYPVLYSDPIGCFASVTWFVFVCDVISNTYWYKSGTSPLYLNCKFHAANNGISRWSSLRWLTIGWWHLFTGTLFLEWAPVQTKYAHSISVFAFIKWLLFLSGATLYGRIVASFPGSPFFCFLSQSFNKINTVLIGGIKKE